MSIFIALMVPDERLVYMGSYFKEYGYRVVNVGMLHLTLLFIGSYKGVYVYKISEILNNVRIEIPGILKPIGISLLPPNKATNAVVLIDDRSGKLSNARKIIEKRISKYFKISDRYEFVPHITIAKRFKPLDKNKYPEVLALINKLNRILPNFLVVKDICLIETLKDGKYRCMIKLKAKLI